MLAVPVQPNASVSEGQFDWTPPEESVDIREAAGAAREEKESKSQLEGIPEEGQPLLDQNGEASGSGNKQPTVEDEKDDDADKMDTA